MQVCVFVETIGILIYICAGRQMSNNLVQFLYNYNPLATIAKLHKTLRLTHDLQNINFFPDSYSIRRIWTTR